jgi:hypothetical protein
MVTAHTGILRCDVTNSHCETKRWQKQTAKQPSVRSLGNPKHIALKLIILPQASLQMYVLRKTLLILLEELNPLKELYVNVWAIRIMNVINFWLCIIVLEFWRSWKLLGNTGWGKPQLQEVLLRFNVCVFGCYRAKTFLGSLWNAYHSSATVLPFLIYPAYLITWKAN